MQTKTAITTLRGVILFYSAPAFPYIHTWQSHSVHNRSQYTYMHAYTNVNWLASLVSATDVCRSVSAAFSHKNVERRTGEKIFLLCRVHHFSGAVVLLRFFTCSLSLCHCLDPCSLFHLLSVFHASTLRFL